MRKAREKSQPVPARKKLQNETGEQDTGTASLQRGQQKSTAGEEAAAGARGTRKSGREDWEDEGEVILLVKSQVKREADNGTGLLRFL